MDISKGRYWDKAWQLIDDCTPCSPGCDHCWSAAMAHRFKREGEPGHSNGIITDEVGNFDGTIVLHPDRLNVPLKRKKTTVYAVWNDLFHEGVPIDFIAEAFEIIDQSPQHIFLLLTKRPQNAVAAWDWLGMNDDAPPLCNFPFENVFRGLTVCNQQEADEKIPIFLQIPGKKYLSIEPMLGAIEGSPEVYNRDINEASPVGCEPCPCGKHWINMFSIFAMDCFDSVILGGETGHGARPMCPDWVRSVRDQCLEAGVPFFFKGWGEWHPMGQILADGTINCSDKGEDPINFREKGLMVRFGHKKAGRLLDGREHNDLPWRTI